MNRLGFALAFVSSLAAAADRPESPIRFEDATAQSGIQFTHSYGAQRLGSLLESTGAGCVWFDYNGDGKQDLYLLSGRPQAAGFHPYPLRKPPAVTPTNKLYRNDGGGKFTDVTEQAGVAGDSFSFSAVAADYDRDGKPDLLVNSYGKVTLYRNQGDGTFKDVTAAAGLAVDGWAISAAWLDYDRDGCIDVFVGRYVKFDPKYRAYYAADNYPGPLDYEAETNKLFRNTCKGGFTDVSQSSGIAKAKARAMGVTAADYDGDGYPDIYVANDKTESFLFHNLRNGTFEEVAVKTGTAFGQNGESSAAMGPVFFDMDGDGRFDLWVSDSKYNRLLKNVGGTFRDATDASGISQLTAQYVSWGTGAYDFDNDGFTDIMIFHGGLVHMIPQEHSLFRGVGDGKFVDVSASAGGVLDVKTVGRGACFADYDNDGRIDAYLVNLGSPGMLLHNTSANTNHWIELQLAGRKSNPEGIGALIEITAGGKTQRRQHVAGSGYLAQDDGRVHFGLGAAAKIEKISITWPSGTRQLLTGVASDQVLKVEEKVQ